MTRTCTYADDNFLEETYEFLKSIGKTGNDVLWVGDASFYMSWEDFIYNADFLYDKGFGIQEIRMDLMIVGKDWWLTRYEYDGSEKWDYHSYPNKPLDQCPQTDLQKFLLNSRVKFIDKAK